ncbi:MAG: helix-turn-helix transcriptional regulator [Thermodesulfobacteriota bacterium]|nr:MAG: helix-turn-helix transcriptional regulator [Thermodesulfobacteriota bacterium]
MTKKELFGIRVKSLRENRGWTQEFMAERMNISPNYLSSIERGKENPTFDLLIRLADSLEIDAWELFAYEHEENPEELKKALEKILKNFDEGKIRLAVKLLKAMTR